ncbi:MAG: molybdopterin synthase catalytic subunit MoaE [Burkholderiales bacterium]|jgi:molybdopterin synthase catalytic subunit|nr:molybdopterin synthase catalytic subunit MoaE [Betaproteobacteria bacterium]
MHPADSVRVQTAPFDIGDEHARIAALSHATGAIASFTGLMRDTNEGDAVRAMTLEHYPGMTEAALVEIVTDARKRWALQAVTVVHRVGTLLPGEAIVLVLTASAHRGEAFSACEFIMDYLKTRAPFWKKEETPAGSRWVDARASDDDAAARWIDDGVTD